MSRLKLHSMDQSTYHFQRSVVTLLNARAQEAGDQASEYFFWGYTRGLARAFHGDRYGVEHHEKFLGYAAPRHAPLSVHDFKNYQIGLGYLAGLEGRPLDSSPANPDAPRC